MFADAMSVRPAAADEIVQRCLRGDRTAWDAIARQHHQAEDLTHDIVLELVNSRSAFDQRASSRMSFRQPELLG